MLGRKSVRRPAERPQPRAVAGAREPTTSPSVQQLLALQRTAGNAAVSRALLQREMTEEQAAEAVGRMWPRAL